MTHEESMSLTESDTSVRKRFFEVGWVAAGGGVVISAAVSVLLLFGTRMIDNGFSLLMYTDLRVGVVLAAGLGAIVAVVIVMPRVHPLLSAIPVAWLLIAYVPPLFSPNALTLWYPDPFFTLVLNTFGVAPFILLGAFSTAAIRSALARDTSPRVRN